MQKLCNLICGISDKNKPYDELKFERICKDPEQVATCRERLKDLSWFMRCLNESLAKRANREDRCTGRFWEGRFKCQRLMDEGAYLSLVEWTGRNIRVDKPGYIPVNIRRTTDLGCLNFWVSLTFSSPPWSGGLPPDAKAKPVPHTTEPFPSAATVREN